jgi:Protein of unknown function (DUF998)
MKGSGWTTRWLAACGIVAPLLDVLVTAWLGALDPSYRHARQYISELGEPGRPYAAVFAAWCALYGLLLTAFALALHRGTGGPKGAWLGPGTFVALGALSILGGIFPCDPGCAGRTFSARMHLLTGEASAVGVLLSPFFTWAGMRGEAWRGYRAFTLLAGGLVVAAGGWLAACQWASGCPVGAAQRLLLGAWYVWLGVVAVRLWRLARAAVEPGGTVL